MSGKDVRVGRYRRHSKASHAQPRDPDRCPICGKPNATHPTKVVDFYGKNLVMNG